MAPYVTPGADGTLLKVYVQPRASRDQVLGLHGDSLKIRLTAVPAAGEANKHLLKFLAKKLGVPRSRVTIKSGSTSRTKLIAVQGISVEEVVGRLGRF